MVRVYGSKYTVGRAVFYVSFIGHYEDSLLIQLVLIFVLYIMFCLLDIAKGTLWKYSNTVTWSTVVSVWTT